MPTRHEYRLDLARYSTQINHESTTRVFRHPTGNDVEILSQLMLDAYRNTIDDDGETLEDARHEIIPLLDREDNKFLFTHSWLCVENGQVVSACLVTFWAVRQAPLISFVMTAPQAKGKGLAASVLHRSLNSLKAAGHGDVHAFITEGNQPSERLHLHAGFEHLPLYHWSICPTPIRQQVTDFVQHTAQIMGKNLVGIYLHGSMCFGCFNPHRSDIDLLVVSEQLLDIATKRAVAQLLLASSRQSAPFEISFLARQQLHPWQYPTPFDFHYSEEWREKISAELSNGSWQHWQPNNTTVTGDVDLAGHITVINERGIVLAGEAIADVFPAIPTEHYRDSIFRDINAALDDIEQNPVYTILNTCRTFGWLKDGKIRSKDAGGVWALHHFQPALQPLIWQAILASRATKAISNNTFSRTELASFAKLSLKRLKRYDENHSAAGSQQQQNELESPLPINHHLVQV